MGVITILLIASICVAACFLIAFLWAARSGQYDDIHTPAMRMLFDDKKPKQLS
jgi:cbb3-type cytochrome oxidase maturation protein